MDEINILIVDNELLTRDLLGNHLKHLGPKVFAVKNSAEARTLIPHGAFRLAILNRKLGEKTIKELIDQLHACEIDALVFLISSQSLDVESLSRLGAYDAFVKPFRLEDVSLKIKHAHEVLALRRAVRVGAERVRRLEGELAGFRSVEEQVRIPDLGDVEVEQPGPHSEDTGGQGGAGRTETDGEAAASDTVRLIRQLDELRQAGIINEAEFNSKKKELLKRI